MATDRENQGDEFEEEEIPHFEGQAVFKGGYGDPERKRTQKKHDE